MGRVDRSLSGWVSGLVFAASLLGMGTPTALAQSQVEQNKMLTASALRNATLADDSIAADSFTLSAVITDPTIVELAFEVCSESPAWVRPDESEQMAYLEEMPRYGTALEQAPLRAVFENFWTESVFSFTSYGLSARQEPIYFSGLWTLLESDPILDNCYNSDRIAQINDGQLAEIWVIGHRVRSVQWTGDRYVILVEPTATGVQFVQFPRQDHKPQLPVQVITEEDVELNVVSAETIFY